ncbi:hypothetical protein PInf_007766 [Phytophthora infestans]|nr:hypothetical protein PInf_007766 [Phytophthora infestans]
MGLPPPLKRVHVSDSDHNNGEDIEDFEGVSVSFTPFCGEFKSWDAFHEELKRYHKETYQLYKIRSTNSVADRNKQCRAILRYFKEVSGKVVLPKDVKNLIAKMRKETYSSGDDNVCVAQVLKGFSEGRDNAVNIFRDKPTGLTSCVTFQTAHMRRMVRKLPDAVCIDATYVTNINR